MSSIDELAAAFFGAFDNTAGAAGVDVIYELCVAEAVIVNATPQPPVVYDLKQFIEPRRALLAGGSIAQFREYETSFEMDVYERIARRTSRYEKSWIEAGVARRGEGLKLFSFVLMPAGWKIASVIWIDRP